MSQTILLPVGVNWRTYHLEPLMSSKLNYLLLQACFSDINKTSIVRRQMRMVAPNSLQQFTLTDQYNHTIPADDKTVLSEIYSVIDRLVMIILLTLRDSMAML